ncbi:hypothetical protein ACIBFB_08435 [Nocardiopsis sp. NPDC050513]|uniref:hypothetical protein n=1 Tax=Nocardiopsis sp. NPDC050513 TaxID=3364338 RepID=UPI0037A34522
MDRLTALREHLRSLPVDRVADILGELVEGVEEDARRDLLPYAASAVARSGVFDALTAAQCDLLVAAADVAARTEAEAGRPGRRVRRLGGPVAQPLHRGELLARIGTWQGTARRAAEAALGELEGRALVWPAGDDRYHLALGLVEAFGVHRWGPRVYSACSEVLADAELHRVALALGADPTREPATLRRGIVTRLTDPGRVNALLATAPEGAVTLLRQLAARGRVLATDCFEEDGRSRYRFRPEGSGDPDTDWLAERGLLVPVGPNRAMPPREVAAAVRESAPLPFTPCPPEPVGVPTDATAVADQASAAVGAALASVDRLVAAVAARPVVLHGAAGIAFGERDRLVEAVGGGAAETGLWVETAYEAGLLVRDGRRITTAAWVRSWARADPARRVAPLMEAWLRLPGVPTWCPDGRELSIPGAQALPGAPALRSALVLALGALPEGLGSGVTSGPLLTSGIVEDRGGSLPPGLFSLVRTALWFRPAAGDSGTVVEAFVHSLHEAELLGVAAQGALSPLGRALAGCVRGGSGRCGDGELERGAAALLHGTDAPSRGDVPEAPHTCPTPTVRFGRPLVELPARARRRRLLDWARSLADDA